MAVTSRGVVAHTAGQPGRLESLRIDDPGPGEVLVKVLASGVCHTDLHFQQGHIGTLPVLMGHEGAGIVEAVGPGVTRPSVGEYVVLAWRAPCGECRFCLIGKPHLCAASLNAVPRQHTSTGEVMPTIMGLGTFATVSLIQSNFGQPCNLEVVVNAEGVLMAFFRDSGPAFHWFGPYEITASS